MNVKIWNSELDAQAIGEDIYKTIKGQHISYGPVSHELEAKLCEILQVNYLLTCSSGSTALLMALKVLRAEKDSEVILPNYSFQATLNAVIMAGFKPVLADIHPITGLICSNHVEKLITKKTKGIILAHLNGRSSWNPYFHQLNNESSISLIEDCAQAFYGKEGDQYLGTIGDFGCYSFGPTKFITSGQGGFITTRNEHHFERLKDYLFHSFQDCDGEYHFPNEGFNFRYNDILATIAQQRLSQIDHLKSKACELYQWYQNHAPNIIEFIYYPNELQFPLWVEGFSNQRNDILSKLNNLKIQAVPFYPPISESNFLENSDKKQLKNSYLYSHRGFKLPCGPSLSLQDKDSILKAFEVI